MKKINLYILALSFFITNLLYAQPETARLQVIHNAADPAASSVDVYLDGALLLDDFAFRAATPFIDAPANTEIHVGVAPGNSTSAADTLKNFTLNLMAGETYVAVANGVLAPGSFAANPDGLETGFGLFINAMGQEMSKTSGNVEFALLHGSTDAPTVDIVARDVTTLADNAAYGAFTGYLSVPPAPYIVDIQDETGSVTVVSYDVDLGGLANGAAVVFASGFFDPSQNQDGEGFGVFAALPTGDVVEFPALTTARLQVIHNAADPAASSVDVYLDGALLLDDFAFRAATPFIDAPANTEIHVGVAPGNSTSAADTLKNFTLNLMAGETYVAVANGVLAPGSFAANPDGLETGFGLFINAMGQEMSKTSGNVEFALLHGSTDAPTVDIVARDVTTLADNAAYGAFTGYLSVPPAPYIVDIQDETGSVTVVSYDVDLGGLANGAAVVFASGFFDPSQNQDGEGFGVFAALPTGDVVEFKVYDENSTDIGYNESVVITDYKLNQNYPNPFNPSTTISFALPADENVTIQIFDLLGKNVAEIVNNRFSAGNHEIKFDARNLASGVYFYQITAGSFKAIQKMTLMK